MKTLLFFSTFLTFTTLYAQQSPVWLEQQKVVGADVDSTDYFGLGVAIWGDYAAVSAPFKEGVDSVGNFVSDAGAVYIFKYDSAANQWLQTQKIAGGSGSYIYGYRSL